MNFKKISDADSIILSPEVEEMLQALEKNLKEKFPLGVPRSKLDKATGGLLHGRTEANMDALGKGIPGGFKFGKHRVYPPAGIMVRIRGKISVEA